MSDFIQKFHLYQSKPTGFNVPEKSLFADSAKYIKTSILSIFDGSIANFMARPDGVIDSNEFESVSKKDYEKYVKDIESYYKQNTGKELKYHIPTYNELKKMLENDAVEQNNYSRLIRKITPEEIEEPIKPNARIGQSNQAGSGECYQNAADMALSYGKYGAQLLKNSIKESFLDGYDVTLYGTKDKNGKPIKYHFSSAELKNAQEEYINMTTVDAKGNRKTVNVKRYSSGDADVVLLDLAIEKYRKETNYKLRPQDKKAVKGYDDYLSGGLSGNVFQLITGKTGYREQYQFTKMVADAAAAGAPPKKTYNSNPNKDKLIETRLNNIEINKDRMASTCTFLCSDNKWANFKKYDLYEAHAYAIKSVNKEKGYVEISNPHSGRDVVIQIPIAEFKKYVAAIEFAYLK